MNKLDHLLPLIEANAGVLKKPGVVSVRPGYRIENDWPTTTPAIVVVLAQGAERPELPEEIDGVAVDVRTATPAEQLRSDDPARFAKIAARRPELTPNAFAEAAAPPIAPLAAKPQLPYEPASVPLKAVTGNLSITCHASPDAGFPTLKTFLAATKKKLTVGLYDFTSKHILDAMKSATTGGKKLTITLDSPALNPTADQSDSDTLKALGDELGDDFQSAWALVRSNKNVKRWIYPTAYHIKVAVRDGDSVWLSSGNWNNSNQPDFDPVNKPGPDDQKTARKSDRDWHVIVDSADLARTYEAYLQHDFDIATQVAEGGGPAPLAFEPGVAVPASFHPEAKGTWQFFAPLRLENEPMTITPLLTPDPGDYRDAMLALMQSAKKKLYIQLQYIHPSDSGNDDDFNALIDVVAQKTASIDVKIICSQYQLNEGWLERLQSAGVNLGSVKIQNGVHNKGFVIDSRIVALGSQNWSGDGVLRNRDASVIIENEKAAKYYESIFLHDWTRIARKSVSQ